MHIRKPGLSILCLALAVSALSPVPASIAAPAQTVEDRQVPSSEGLNLPEGLALFGNQDPNIRTAKAVVNGEIVTGTDIDQRLALVVASGDANVAPEEMQRLRVQVLRNLIDETLQIQEAKGNDIEIADAEVEEAFGRVVKQNGAQSLTAFSDGLTKIGSGPATMKRQIRAELAWSRLLRRNIQPFVNVSEDEVKAIIERLNAAKGSTEYRLGEIYLSATQGNETQVAENARRIMQQIQQGASFSAYARQFSEASTAAVGGDLGWIRLEQLPASLAEAAKRIEINQLVGPIAAPGGMSILYLIDRRQVLTSDPRDAVLSLKQLAISFPPGASKAQVEAVAKNFAQKTQAITGCSQADAVAKEVGAEIVNRDGIAVRDLPPQLQTVLGNLQLGQASPPYGSPEEGVRVFVSCGRENAGDGNAPSFDAIMTQLENERVAKRARIYLRDLQRDAIIEYN